MSNSSCVPLVELTRGNLVESFHSGCVAVVDAAGHLVAGLGDPYYVTYLRSSSKPFQILPLLENGGVETFHLTDREIALMCASHSGTDEHLAAILALQEKVGLRESDLLCGTHPVYHQPTQEALIRRGESPTPNRHNCSGKHTGFLAQAVLSSFSKAEYINPTHPVQQRVLQTFAEMVNYPVEKVIVGVDGCSAPVFAVPLYHAAWGFARLADPRGLPEKRAQACRRVTHAMAAEPFMVAGPDRFDTLAMEAGQGKFICKAGAEGYQAIAVMPGALGENSPALGIAFKVADGDPSGRARPVIAAEILRQLGLLRQEDLDTRLSKLAARRLTNWRGLEIGEIRPVFHLNLS
ncbi:MAG: asparaginase [Bellilinea sp.]|nr:MAG: asparaginase [Bellilinea sp.]